MRKYKYLFISFLWALVMAVSCRHEDISFSAPTSLLRFSRDTVFCDTVYNQVRSETYAFKVYNTENQDIKIPHIYLKGGSSSLYRINVDGKSGTDFTNVALRKKDSLFVFVEIAPVANAPQAIAEDQVLFDGTSQQHVMLFSVVQDAEFFIESKTNPNILSGNTTWNSNKAKIIFGNLTLAKGATLNIQKGTNVYFHKNSGFTASENSTVNVLGDLGSEVTFRGDRNDTAYDTIPANWKSMDFLPGAVLNMNYAKVFGGTTGLNFTESTGNITNSIIHTFSEVGISAVHANITASNLVTNNCANSAISIGKGGTYSFTQCTLANFWNMGGAGANLSLYAANTYTNAAGQTENAALDLKIVNSILYGNATNSVVLKPTAGQIFNYNIQNCLLKYSAAAAGFSFDNNANITASIQNQDPKFMNYFTQKLNLRVAADSPAKSKGNAAAAATVPLDLVKTSRTSSPTIGAYQ